MSEGVGGADRHSGGGWIWLSLTGCVTNFRISEASVQYAELGNAIGSGMGLSITIDKLRVFINKTLSILSAYQ